MKPVAGFVKSVKSALQRLFCISILAPEVRVPQTSVSERDRADELRHAIEELLNDRLFMKEFFNHMDAETKRICEWQLLGYTIDQIADELNTTSESLSERYMNGLGRATMKALRIKRD